MNKSAYFLALTALCVSSVCKYLNLFIIEPCKYLARICYIRIKQFIFCYKVTAGGINKRIDNDYAGEGDYVYPERYGIFIYLYVSRTFERLIINFVCFGTLIFF